MFKELYFKEIVPFMNERFNYKNPMLVPSISKICLNVGLGEAVSDSNVLEPVLKDLTSLCGQKAVPTVARKSISTFKLRKGMHIGCKVTLRGSKMYYFLEKLVYVALASERDFRGIKSKSITKHGHCSFSIKEHIVFPEVDYDRIHSVFGVNVNIVTSSSSSLESRVLLGKFGLPFYD